MVVIAICFLAIMAYLYKTRSNGNNVNVVKGNNISQDNYIEVSGECIDYLQPDIFTIDFTISGLEKKTTDSLNKARNTYNNIEEKLLKLNLQLPKLTINNLNTFVKAQDVKYKQKISKVNYYETMVDSSLIIKNEQDLIIAINFLSTYENVTIKKITSHMSDKMLNNKKQDCLINSISNANKKATALALSLNKSLGDIVAVKEIDENKSYTSSQNYTDKNNVSIKERELRVYSNVRFVIN
jgi:uncharacterized protein YggE